MHRGESSSRAGRTGLCVVLPVCGLWFVRLLRISGRDKELLTVAADSHVLIVWVTSSHTQSSEDAGSTRLRSFLVFMNSTSTVCVYRPRTCIHCRGTTSERSKRGHIVRAPNQPGSYQVILVRTEGRTGSAGQVPDPEKKGCRRENKRPSWSWPWPSLAQKKV